MMILTPAQCRAARAWLNLSQQELSDRSKVAQRTIALFEIEERLPRERTLVDLRRVFEELGMSFTFEGMRAAGIVVSASVKPLQRVRRKSGADAADSG
jgi:predicted transcriptional regulator